MTIEQITRANITIDEAVFWNYFLVLENDLFESSRFVDFSMNNMKTNSIAFAQIIISASAEVDVIAKMLISKIDDKLPAKNIIDYRKYIIRNYPDFPKTEIFLTKHNLKCTPWLAWESDESPSWWRSYTKLKHQRNDYYAEATLENAISSISGLLAILFQYYFVSKSEGSDKEKSISAAINCMHPDPKIMRLNSDYYPKFLCFG